MADIKITITIPENKQTLLLNVYGERYKDKVVDENEELVDNPQSKGKFAKEEFIKEVRSVVNATVKRYKIRESKKEIVSEELVNIV